MKFAELKLYRYLRNIYQRIFALFLSSNLIQLAICFQTDKWGGHYYAKHYQKYFRPLRRKKLNIFEIGVGGYASPVRGGASLRMWKAYFPKSTIYSIDIYDKKALEEKRIKIFQGSQDDPTFLKEVVNLMQGGVDIIIDDGSHINESIIKSFEILFPLLNENGVYVAEDLQTSYWPGFGGDSEDLINSNTAMNYFKKLADSLNYKELIKPGYVPTYFDKNITSIHFYHNIVFIFKGANTEESNRIKNNSTNQKRIVGSQKS